MKYNKLTVGRKLFLSQELNRRIRAQHDRLRSLYDTVPKGLHQFMVIMLEAGVDRMEQEEQQGNLVVAVPRGMTPEELGKVQQRLQAMKEGKV